MAAEYAYKYDYGSPAVRDNQALPKKENKTMRKALSFFISPTQAPTQELKRQFAVVVNRYKRRFCL